MRLIDSHAHLQAEAFAWDRAKVIAAAREAGVERILIPGWDAGSSELAVRVSDEQGWVDAAVGIHPNDAAVCSDADWKRVLRLATHSRVVAIGETGLDFDRMSSPADVQVANLRRHLYLALDVAKPVILHCRSAEGKRTAQVALLAELRAAGFGGAASRAAFGDRPPAVLHSFSGSVDYARVALDMGIAIAFGGLVFRRGEEASAEVARFVPSERLLVETDSPYLAPAGVPRSSTPGFDGRRNSPEWVRITVEWLAKQLGVTPDSIGAGLVAAYDATFRRHSPI
jgi:TatD DNase family protein